MSCLDFFFAREFIESWVIKCWSEELKIDQLMIANTIQLLNPLRLGWPYLLTWNLNELSRLFCTRTLIAWESMSWVIRCLAFSRDPWVFFKEDTLEIRLEVFYRSFRTNYKMKWYIIWKPWYVEMFGHTETFLIRILLKVRKSWNDFFK